MKIALAQMRVVPGRPEINVDRMLKMITEAKIEKADVIAFPEMCVGGYLLGDRWLDEDYCRYLMSFNEKIKEASENICIIYGNVFLEENAKGKHPNKDGRIRKYNSVYIYQNKQPVSRKTKILPEDIDVKTLHPNYRIFDDERYFFSLQDVSKDYRIPLKELAKPFEIDLKGNKMEIGLEICEDLWCEDYRMDEQPLNKTKFLIDNGAKLIINISASPWTYGKNGARDRRVKFLKQESNEKFVPFLYVNCVGTQNNGKNIVTFDGGTTAYNKEGLPIKFIEEQYEEKILYIEKNDLEETPKERKQKSKIEEKYLALIEGIRGFIDNVGMKEYPPVVIGLSGGIDSTIVAALFAEAIGKEKIIGINMPTKYNSEKTKNAARFFANNLGIRYCVAPIESLVKENTNLLESQEIFKDGIKLSTLNIENVQAKIRGTSILSNIAAKYGGFFTNNGNKDEVLLGYATLYGDVGGVLAPIGDLTKIEVIKLAKYMNEKIYAKEKIPTTLLPDELWNFRENQIQPSAELKDNQIDPMKFVYHCALVDMATDYKKYSKEKILQLYLDGKLHKIISSYLKDLYEDEEIGINIMKRWNLLDPKVFLDDLDWFFNQYQRNVFKRVQSPPIIITSKSSFGYDIRESILPINTSGKETELKEKINKLKIYEQR